MEFARESERNLVVEDNPGVREVPATILRYPGYEVVEAGDRQEAKTTGRVNTPLDLLFADVVLPGGMTGVEVADPAKRLQPGIKFSTPPVTSDTPVPINGSWTPA
jgi:CheY-like chemotaxis protein